MSLRSKKPRRCGSSYPKTASTSSWVKRCGGDAVATAAMRAVCMRMPRLRLRDRLRPPLGVVAPPEVEVVLRVAENIGPLVGAHLPHGLGGHAHDEPTRLHDPARRHEGARADLGTFL